MNNTPLNILYVEDNPTDVKTVRRYFREMDNVEAKLDSAGTTRQALQMLDENDYDLAITDYRLPDGNGLEFLTQLNRRAEPVATIMLTGKGSEQLAAKSMRRGADDYLAKADLSPNTLKFSINFVLDRVKQAQTRQETIVELKKKAELDELTGLHNRRSLENRLNEETKRGERYGNSLCVMMIDLDQFKPINDEYGHVKGDEVLKKTGELIMNTTREADFPARYGGDEFCIICPQTGASKAESLAERIRVTLKEELQTCFDEDLVVTCSIGITEYHSTTDSPRTLIHEADKAMYTAKEMGGDQVFVICDHPDYGVQPGA